MQEILQHPWLSVPVAGAAVVNPLWVEHLSNVTSLGVQVLGGIYLVVQIYYLFKNKGKK